MSKRKPEPMVVVFEDADPRETVPVECRLKRFLKAALRAYGLRCKWVQALPDGVTVPGLEVTEAIEEGTTR